MADDTKSAACAKCGYPRRAGTSECPRCGVIFDKLRAASPSARAGPARGPARPTVRTPSSYVSPAALARFLLLAAQTLEAGLTLRSLATTPAPWGWPRRLLARVRADLLADASLVRSLGEQGLLDRGLLALLGARETQGELPAGLRAAAELLDHRAKLRAGLLLALAYPTFLVVAAAALVPLPLAFTQGWGGYLMRVGPVLLGVAALAALVGFVQPRLGREGRFLRAVRAVGYRLPVLGPAGLSSALAALAGVLGGCLKAGLPAREALALAAESADHPAFAEASGRLTARLEEGATLALALGAVPAIPIDFLAEVDAAERSGTLDEVLPALGERHARRARFLWMLAAALASAAVFAVVLATLAFEVVSGWMRILREQGQAVDRLSG